MSARNPCSVIVAGEKKSLALSSLRGKSGTFMMPAYSTGGLPPTAWVISAVIDWLGRVLRSVQESPPSSETKMGAVVLVDPPGLGVKAEAARSFGFDAYSARNGSASCQVSPLSDTDRKSTRLNSSHSQISYAVFCLKKKKLTRDIAVANNKHSPTVVRVHDGCAEAFAVDSGYYTHILCKTRSKVLSRLLRSSRITNV